MRNVMVDLETLGTAADSAIIAIGACKFNSREVGSTFYCNVDLKDAQREGFTLDADTILWWLGQSDEARKAITAPRKPPLSVRAALAAFSAFIGEGANVWGNGANFDNKILEAAYRHMGMEIPWKFWNDRCFRTVKAMCPNAERVEPKVAHHALHDAVAQAMTLMKMQEEWPELELLL